MSKEQRGGDSTGTMDPGPEVGDSARASSSDTVPELSKGERREVEERTSISAVVVHETVREEGEHELCRPPSALAWSGLAAGLSMGFSLVAQGLLHAYLPRASWTPLIDNLGYSAGFLIVILGRQQLFTENTLTPILPLLQRRPRATPRNVLRLWAVVLCGNLLGGLALALVAAHTSVFDADVQGAFRELGTK